MDYNVVKTYSEWVQQCDLMSSTVTALTPDIFNVTAFMNMFDGFAISLTGMYKDKSFMVESQPIKTIKQAIEFASQLPEGSLLYGFEQIADADQFQIGMDVPAKYLLRYAIPR